MSALVEALQRDVERVSGRAPELAPNPPGLGRLLPPLPTGRHADLIAMGAAVDVTQWALGAVPVVGDILADIVGDNIEADMMQRMTPAEQNRYREDTRFLPSGVAVWQGLRKGAR